MTAIQPRVAFEVRVQISDEKLLMEEFHEDVGAGTACSALMHYLTNTAKQPSDAGYKVNRRSLQKLSEDSYRLKVTATITDEAKFRSEAIELAEANYGHGSEMAKGSLSELLAEIVTISNASGSPSDYGYSILGVMDAEPHPARAESEPALG